MWVHMYVFIHRSVYLISIGPIRKALAQWTATRILVNDVDWRRGGEKGKWEGVERGSGGDRGGGGSWARF